MSKLLPRVLVSLASLASIASLAVLSSGCAAERAGAGDEEGTSAANAGAVSDVAQLVFDGSYRQTLTGALRAGGKVAVTYDANRLTTCRGDEGGRPQWSISLVYRVGGGDLAWVPVAGVMAPPDGVVTLDLPRGGDLEIWFQNSSKYGCVAYDSDYGRNYHFAVAPRADAPGWMGNAASAISRATCDGDACDADRRALDGGFRFDDWARQRATVAGAYFDVWKAGVTDFDDPDLWRQLDARVHYRVVGAGAWSWAYVDFERRVGHDARYEVPLRTLDPLGGRARATRAECPEGTLRVSADGASVEMDVELYFEVNGVELRPSGGGAFRGTSTIASCTRCASEVGASAGHPRAS